MSGCELQETDTGKRDNWDIRMDASWMARIHRWSRMKKFQRKRNHLIARKGWMSKKKKGTRAGSWLNKRTRGCRERSSEHSEGMRCWKSMSRTYGLYDRMAISYRWWWERLSIVTGRVGLYSRKWESYCRIQHLRPPVPWLLYGSSARPTGPHTEGTWK